MPPTTMSEKDQFIQTWEKEFETTSKVLRSCPPGKEDFRPAPKSRTTRELAWMFVIEEQVFERMTATPTESKPMAPPPAVPLSEIIATYETNHREIAKKVQAAPADLFEQMINFPVGKGKMEDVPKRSVYWLMLLDSVHHRGQFSVYLRMLDARVPSIYGGSLDEPWV
jgi:uncharacterized damage-inducible protein DinB